MLHTQLYTLNLILSQFQIDLYSFRFIFTCVLYYFFTWKFTILPLLSHNIYNISLTFSYFIHSFLHPWLIHLFTRSLLLYPYFLIFYPHFYTIFHFCLNIGANSNCKWILNADGVLLPAAEEWKADSGASKGRQRASIRGRVQHKQ